MRYLSILIPVLLFVFTSPGEAQVIGSLTYVEGRVDILHSGQVRFTPCSEGDPVFLTDIVRTGANGRVVIEFTNGNNVSLAPFTRIDIEEYLGVKERSNSIKLSRGKVKVTTYKLHTIPVVIRREPGLELHTSIAVMCIRG